ncbi:DUF2889 domain-containing protein [Pseudomonas sp. GD03860]|uniref:DUF2889 domain-containing protein n=1 Tax=Pseudomonas TaxID=286 RepID=UPI002363BC27|nr:MULTISPECIES: DUF2889 domain-containing protein [Pseudomonas]MDD2058380.1 DUF2889 domain-containing protein [Pseudomonas putida]MDH0636310.1 DUF2889 domain-containing protein [Pseudomonas sp. GD03860]
MSDKQPHLLGPIGHAPLRRAASIRRTTSIDVFWPGGYGSDGHFRGIGRDIYSNSADSPPQTLALQRFEAVVSPQREIARLSTVPARPSAMALVGLNAGSQLRKALDGALAEDLVNSAPLYLLLDDLAGASLVANWAWSRWGDGWLNQFIPISDALALEQRRNSMTGVCTGFAEGSSAITDIRGQLHDARAVPALAHPDDPAGWHRLPASSGVTMRRARRIDVWHEQGRLRIDAMFQDSASTPDGGRMAVHEYGLQATADTQSAKLLTLVAQPRVLPYPECPAAADNVSRLIGLPLASLRQQVLLALRRELGCTHLNDALRALAEVPALARCI